jgi:hypothetical protein
MAYGEILVESHEAGKTTGQDHPLILQRCSSRYRRLPRPLQVQAPQGDFHRRRGNLYRIIHLLRKEGYLERRKRPPHLSMPGRYHCLQRRGEDWRPRSARQDLG